MEAEGVEFRCNANIGVNVPTAELRDGYDAMLLTGGATAPRDLPIPGRNLTGIYFAMEFLPQQNARNQGDAVPDQILATGKDTIVIGGGDTGSDCTGTSNRQGCRSLTQFELLPQPPDVGNYPRANERPPNSPWPLWPMILRTSTSHEEGCQREWSILTKEFRGDASGQVESLVTVRVEWVADANGRQTMREVPGTEQVWPCQLVLLAMGFLGPGAKRPDRRSRPRTRPARQRQDRRQLHDEPRRRLRRRRPPSRPIARRLGHPRRPRSRPRHRQTPHGRQPSAERERRRFRLAMKADRMMW